MGPAFLGGAYHDLLRISWFFTSGLRGLGNKSFESCGTWTNKKTPKRRVGSKARVQREVQLQDPSCEPFLQSTAFFHLYARTLVQLYVQYPCRRWLQQQTRNKSIDDVAALCVSDPLTPPVSPSQIENFSIKTSQGHWAVHPNSTLNNLKQTLIPISVTEN